MATTQYIEKARLTLAAYEYLHNIKHGGVAKYLEDPNSPTGECFEEEFNLEEVSFLIKTSLCQHTVTSSLELKSSKMFVKNKDGVVKAKAKTEIKTETKAERSSIYLENLSIKVEQLFNFIVLNIRTRSLGEGISYEFMGSSQGKDTRDEAVMMIDRIFLVETSFKTA